jgi:hypothetical protein
MATAGSGPLLKLLKPGEWPMNLPRRPHTCPRRHLCPYRANKRTATPRLRACTRHAARTRRTHPSATITKAACVRWPIQPNPMARRQMVDKSKTSLSTTRKPLTGSKPV